MAVRRAPVLAGLLLTACSTTGRRTLEPPVLDPTVSAGVIDALQDSDPVQAAARAWVELNDRARARAILERATERSPEEASGWLWLALLDDDDLRREQAYAHARRCAEAGVDEPAGRLCLGLLAAWTRDGATSTPRAAPRSLPSRALLASLRTQSEPASADRLQEGGWLVDWTVRGPVGVDDPVVFERWNQGVAPRAPPPGPARRSAPVRGPRVEVSAGGRAGLYEARTCLQVAIASTVEVWARTEASGQLTLAGTTVGRPDADAWWFRADLEPGSHPLTLRLRVAPGQTIRFAATVPSGPCPTDGPGPSPTRIMARPLRPAARSWADHWLESSAARRAGLASARDVERHLGWVVERAEASALLLRAWRNWLFDDLDDGLRLQLIRRAVDLDPEAPRAWLELADALGPDQRAEAARAMDAAERLAPHDWLVHWYQHRWLDEEGRTTEAVERLQRAFAAGLPTRLHDAANRFLRRSRRLDLLRPLRAEPHWSLVEALAREGRIDDALVQAYALAERGDPSVKWSLVAQWELDRGRFERAGAAARRARERDPLDDAALRTLLIASTALDDRVTSDEAWKGLARAGALDLDAVGLSVAQRGLDPFIDTPDGWLRTRLRFDPWSLLAPVAGRSIPRGLDRSEPWSAYDDVILLDRVVDRIWPDGSVLSEQHAVIRVQTREAVDAFGEVRVPGNAIVLALRTLEPDGTAMEADRHPGKIDVSFSHLEPGDGVERRWLRLESPSTPTGGYIRRFYLRGGAPSHRSDLVALLPASIPFEHRSINGAPEPYLRRTNDMVTAVWQSGLQPAIPPEPFTAPPEEHVPFVVIWAGTDVMGAREANLRPARLLQESTPWVEAFARTRFAQGSDDSILSRILDWVEEEIEVGPPRRPFATLINRRGSRTVLAVALARAVGIDADLVLMRSGTAPRVRTLYPDPQRFRRLVGRARMRSSTVWFSLERDDVFRGRLPSSFRGGSYLEVTPLGPPRPKPVADAWIRDSVQEAIFELAAETDGSVTGTVTWSLTDELAADLTVFAARSPPGQWSRRLEEALGPALPGITLRRVRIESTAEGATLRAAVRMPLFAVGVGAWTAEAFFETYPLAEVFGLPGTNDYARLPHRSTPMLLVESHERLTVRLRMPDDLRSPFEFPRSFRRITDFGSFQQRITWDPATSSLIYERERSIPQIRVQPEDYGALRMTFQQVAQDSRARVVMPRARVVPQNAN